MKKDLITTIIVLGFIIDCVGWLINDYISESIGFPIAMVGVLLLVIGIYKSIRN